MSCTDLYCSSIITRSYRCKHTILSTPPIHPALHPPSLVRLRRHSRTLTTLQAPPPRHLMAIHPPPSPSYFVCLLESMITPHTPSSVPIHHYTSSSSSSSLCVLLTISAPHYMPPHYMSPSPYLPLTISPPHYQRREFTTVTNLVYECLG